MSALKKNVRDTVSNEFKQFPEKVLQFGEGNFLRAFADWMIEKSNEAGLFCGSVVLCQPIEQGMADKINEQDGSYTVAMRGMEQGTPVEQFQKITSVSRCINPYKDYEKLLAIAESPDLKVVISNTTEAGIAYHAGDRPEDRPPVSYPAKLCALLYHRYRAFHGDPQAGLLILPVELIDNNGFVLKELVLRYAGEWELEEGFIHWLNTANEFTSTLVDRIVTGYPKDSIEEFEKTLGYQDHLLVTCETFNLWVIQGDSKWAEAFPIDRTEANVIWTRDVTPYKKRKVRILNGSHTAVVPCAFLAGYDTVLEFFTESVFGRFETELIHKEILPVLDLPQKELTSFADQVIQRFCNPYIRHYLLDITLNNCSKFSARCLPTILEYHEQTGRIPERFAFALAGFLRFYRIEKAMQGYVGRRDNGDTYPLREDEAVLSFFEALWKSTDLERIAHSALSRTELWLGYDLTKLSGLEDRVIYYLKQMMESGVESTLRNEFIDKQ